MTLYMKDVSGKMICLLFSELKRNMGIRPKKPKKKKKHGYILIQHGSIDSSLFLVGIPLVLSGPSFFF